MCLPVHLAMKRPDHGPSFGLTTITGHIATAAASLDGPRRFKTPRALLTVFSFPSSPPPPRPYSLPVPTFQYCNAILAKTLHQEIDLLPLLSDHSQRTVWHNLSDSLSVVPFPKDPCKSKGWAKNVTYRYEVMVVSQRNRSSRFTMSSSKTRFHPLSSYCVGSPKKMPRFDYFELVLRLDKMAPIRWHQNGHAGRRDPGYMFPGRKTPTVSLDVFVDGAGPGRGPK